MMRTTALQRFEKLAHDDMSSRATEVGRDYSEPCTIGAAEETVWNIRCDMDARKDQRFDGSTVV